MDRRTVLAGLATAAVAPAWAQDSDTPRWSAPVIDMHFHMRLDPQTQQIDTAATIAHQVGAGVTAANLLDIMPSLLAKLPNPQTATAMQAGQLKALRPAMFPCWFAYNDLSKPDGEKFLAQALKSGASGIGEFPATNPDIKRIYAMAADFNVPVLIHIPAQRGDHPMINDIEDALKAFPRTTFIAHANGFWNNVSADYHDQSLYLTGPIVPGGISDKLLSDYPNLYADMSDPSACTTLSTDHGFTTDFLKRHQEKLHFGSDCACLDGRGGGAAWYNSPIVPPTMRGKCIARLTLQTLTDCTTPELFRKLVWTNGHKRAGIPI